MIIIVAGRWQTCRSQEGGGASWTGSAARTCLLIEVLEDMFLNSKGFSVYGWAGREHGKKLCSTNVNLLSIPQPLKPGNDDIIP